MPGLPSAGARPCQIRDAWWVCRVSDIALRSDPRFNCRDSEGLFSWAMVTTLCGETSRQHPGWPEGRQSSNRTCRVPVLAGMIRSHASLQCCSGRQCVALYPWYRRPWNSMDAIEGEPSATIAAAAGRLRVALYPGYRRQWIALDSRCRPVLLAVPAQDERNSSCRRARCAFATSASAGVAGR